MAVSGRKAADFRGSVSRGSAEEFDHCCEPCLTEGQHIEAFRYCVDCQEYLCKNCVRYHQKTKVLKHHQLIEKDKVDSQKPVASSSDTSTEKCSTQTEELVKFFCPEHEVLGCSDCMTMDHRTCKLDYIPDKCKDVGNSQEYRETMKTLEKKLNHLDFIMKKATAKEKEIDICHDKVLREIVKFRKEINDHLDTLQKKIETFRSKKISEDKQKIQTVFSSLSISLKGEVRAALTDKDLGLPRGMLVLDDGSLLLCSSANKVIYKVSGNLKQKQKIADSVESPCCIGFNKNRNEVLLGCSNCDVLKRFLVSHNC
ncbi:E3 ubiquitin-protein ligase TRIM33-like [Mercenaria mercenaria]|uniref:E3 ubiquitin-protein ligase TRIM33-like n=1 Tax=Mercenaria mercenaria TaxID=6596 RepID=UPI00234E7773|nr:E3 ubiquitin-protein ligase TRIM33-like [Mercenaria mercenaria]